MWRSTLATILLALVEEISRDNSINGRDTSFEIMKVALLAFWLALLPLGVLAAASGSATEVLAVSSQRCVSASADAHM